MSSFLVYNTSDPNTGNQPLNNGASYTSPAFQTGTSAKIVGSCMTDKAGTLQVMQSMNYQAVAATSGLTPPTVYWDVVQSFALDGTTPVTIDVDIIGPVARVVFTNTSGSTQGVLRIFLRAVGNRAAS
jgi:hypothetical protein